MFWGSVFISLCAASVQLETAKAQPHDHHHGHDHSGHQHSGPAATPQLLANSFPVLSCTDCPTSTCVNTNMNFLCMREGAGGSHFGEHGGHVDGGHMHGGLSHVDGHSDAHHGHDHGGHEVDPPNSFRIRSCRQCRSPNRCTVRDHGTFCTRVRSTSSSSRCTARSERGRCRARLTRYFYDSRTRTCRSFVFGGCGGNANNYRSRQACERTCRGRRTSRRPSSSSSRRSAVCRLTVNRGWCEGGRRRMEPVTRYYYDTNRGGCFKFRWRGCGGNENRFTSKRRCEKKCDVHEHEAIGHAHESMSHIHETGHGSLGHAHDIGHHGHEPTDHAHGHMDTHGHEGIAHELEPTSHGHGPRTVIIRNTGSGRRNTIGSKLGGLGRLLGGIAGRLFGQSSRSGGLSSSLFGQRGSGYRPTTVVIRRRPGQRSGRTYGA